MKTIYKYPLEVGTAWVHMPRGAIVRSLQVQNERACLWAEVDTTQEQEARRFATFGTGHPIPSIPGREFVFIDSYQLMGGSLMFHVYEDVAVTGVGA